MTKIIASAWALGIEQFLATSVRWPATGSGMGCRITHRHHGTLSMLTVVAASITHGQWM